MTNRKQYTQETIKKMQKLKMKLEVGKKWKEEKYPKSSKCNMIITNMSHCEQIEQAL